MPAIEILSLPVFVVLGLLINLSSIGILLYLAAFLKHEYGRLGTQIASNKMIKIITVLSVSIAVSNLLFYYGSTLAWYLDTPGYVKGKNTIDVISAALVIMYWVLHLYGVSVRTGNSADVLLPSWFTNHVNKALFVFALSGFVLFITHFLWSLDVVDSQTPSAPASIANKYAGTIYTVVVLAVDGIHSYYFGKYVRRTNGERAANYTSTVARYGFRISATAFLALMINTVSFGLPIGTIARLVAQVLSRVVTGIVAILWINMKWCVDDEVDDEADSSAPSEGRSNKGMSSPTESNRNLK